MSLAAGLVASWERWGHPLIDSGREMNVPLRLMRGEMLYSQVRYIYGPLSPYLNAWLYRTFHPSLWVLWINGMATTVVILALTYWLARQIAARSVATFSCLFVTWVCALKPQGSYVLPYAFSALDGAALGLAATALLILWIQRPGQRTDWKIRGWPLVAAAGVCAGLATLAKTESGVAAAGTGVICVALAEFPHARRILSGWIVFLLPAVGLPAAVYAWFAACVGWRTLTDESFLFFRHVPWQLIYFNKLRFGLDRPWHSAWLIAASLARLVAFAGVLAAICFFSECRRKKDNAGPDPLRRTPAALLLASMIVILLTSIGLGDLGPLLPMPLLLLAMIAAGMMRYASEWRASGAGATRTIVFLTLAAFAFGSIGRILFRVSTGGALSSDLLPATVILFVYLWLAIFPSFFEDQRTRRLAEQLVTGVFVVALLVTATTLSARYRRKFTYPIVTARGTMYAAPDIGVGIAEAIRFIEATTKPGDAVAVMPEGTSLDFFTDRRNPLRDEITIPGMLDEAGEERAIADLQRAGGPLVLIANRSTHEFGQTAFGVDYDRRLMAWIEAHYRTCGLFGLQHDHILPVGSPVFFIRAYCAEGATTAPG